MIYNKEISGDIQRQPLKKPFLQFLYKIQSTTNKISNTFNKQVLEKILQFIAKFISGSFGPNTVPWRSISILPMSSRYNFLNFRRSRNLNRYMLLLYCIVLYVDYVGYIFCQKKIGDQLIAIMVGALV